MVAPNDYYTGGTLTVTNGSATVTATTTSFLNQVKAGDMLIVGNNAPVFVGADAATNTSFTLARNWTGTTATTTDYRIYHRSTLWYDISIFSTAFVNFLDGLAASATVDTTNAANITTGTLGAGRLPNPSAGTLGGVNSKAVVANQFLTGIATNGAPTAAQPAFSNLSGQATAAQLPALSGDVTKAAGSATVTIDANAVTNAKLAQMAAKRIKGNAGTVTADAADLTGAQVLAMLPALLSVDLYQTAGTFTWTNPGAKVARVRVVGAGGGGAGATAAASQASAGAGGGAGGYSEEWIDISAIASVTVTVGAGGTAGDAANGAGGAGEASTFGIYVSAAGGAGGAAMASGTAGLSSSDTAGAAASGSGGIQIGGAHGISGIRFTGSSAKSGSGGSSELGVGGRGRQSAGAGIAGIGNGGGGGGALSLSATGFAGAAGSSGAVIVECFY